jgi:glycosyltransferase involved in cell wall biosynthesis
MDLFAQAQVSLGNSVGLYTTTPKFKIRGFPKQYDYHFVPGPVQLMRGLLMNRLNIPRFLYDWDCSTFDKLAARFVEKSDLLLGAATSSLLTGRAAKRNGGKYVLDRACPDIRVQESTILEESKKARGKFETAPEWFLERQVMEYEEADFIVAPSDYSRRSYPAHLREKTVIVRLTGSVKMLPVVEPKPERPFTVGVVGGDPLRKGYMYLLQAWKELGWTDARLLMRTSDKVVGAYPAIAELLASQPNVSFVDYVPDIADFYRQCDAFILPSIDDGFGMAFFEALANGIPSIATSNCGASELLTPEEEFLLIEPFSAEAIRQALQRLRDSPELREKLAVNGWQAIKTLQEHSGKSEYQKGIDELMQRAFPAAV